jgi:hypothetical protein
MLKSCTSWRLFSGMKIGLLGAVKLKIHYFSVIYSITETCTLDVHAKLCITNDDSRLLNRCKLIVSWRNFIHPLFQWNVSAMCSDSCSFEWHLSYVNVFVVHSNDMGWPAESTFVLHCCQCFYVDITVCVVYHRSWLSATKHPCLWWSYKTG